MENVGAIKWLLAEDKSRKARSRNTLKYFMSAYVLPEIPPPARKKKKRILEEAKKTKVALQYLPSLSRETQGEEKERDNTIQKERKRGRKIVKQTPR
uniref:Uncharacterized protein n=1 Tax=Mustela putorius furo TaxID=9669 RepID=M3Y069_MUSPF